MSRILTKVYSVGQTDREVVKQGTNIALVLRSPWRVFCMQAKWKYLNL